MTALNPITSKALSSKMGSMQMLLLTAMTLLGFYLCFKEIRRMSMEMASLRDQVEASAAKPKARAPPPRAVAEDDLGGGVVMVMDDGPILDANADADADADADMVMDEGLRQMLEHLQQQAAGHMASAPPQRAATAEVEEVEDLTHDSLMAKTKAEIEELLRENGVPFKKSDAKNKLVSALVEALEASGEDGGEGDGEGEGEGEDGGDGEGEALRQAVAAGDI